MKASIKILTILPLFVLLSFVDVHAQQKLPKTGFTIDMSSKTLELHGEDAGSVDISILRSKRFKNSKVGFTVSGNVPAGVDIKFDADTTVDSQAKMNVSVAKEAAPGTYTLILYGKTPTFRKGVTFKLVIS